MFRFLSRFIGVWLVAAALVVAVVDGARSIAASSIVLTPLAESWALLATAGTSDPAATSVPANAPWPLDVALAWLLATPTAAVLAVLGFLLLAAGQKRRQRDAFGRQYPA